jgi:hypothetical protein
MPLPVTTALIELKDRVAFSLAAKHVPQSLLELLALGKPVFTTDMANGFKVWKLSGKLYHAYHGDEPLTLAQGVALLRHLAAEGEAAAAAEQSGAEGANASGGAGSAPGAGSGGGHSGGDDSQDDAQQSAGHTPGVGIGGTRQCHVASSANTSPSSDYDHECDFDGPPVDYEDYKLRVMLLATALRQQGMNIPDEVLARLR